MCFFLRVEHDVAVKGTAYVKRTTDVITSYKMYFAYIQDEENIFNSQFKLKYNATANYEILDISSTSFFDSPPHYPLSCV